MLRLPPSLSVVVPAYNEEDRLEPTLRSTVAYFRGEPQRTERRLVEIIVVDDGSRDGTSALVHTLGLEYPELRLIRLAANAGKGYAVRTGVLNARGSQVLVADADGATPIEEYARLDAALTDGAAVAIGSRALRAAGVHVHARLYRRIMGRTYHALVRGTVKGIADTQCGFKLFRGDVAHELFSRMHMRGYAFDVEVLLMAQRRGYRIAEVPVNWTHVPGSRVRIVRDSLLMARDVVVIRTLLLRGAYRMPHVAQLGPLEWLERGVEAMRERFLQVVGASDLASEVANDLDLDRAALGGSGGTVSARGAGTFLDGAHEGDESVSLEREREISERDALERWREGEGRGRVVAGSVEDEGAPGSDRDAQGADATPDVSERQVALEQGDERGVRGGQPAPLVDRRGHPGSVPDGAERLR